MTGSGWSWYYWTMLAGSHLTKPAVRGDGAKEKRRPKRKTAKIKIQKWGMGVCLVALGVQNPNVEVRITDRRITRLLAPRFLVMLAVLSALPAFGGTITVTNTNDSGAGSLRQAIADGHPAGGDTINFSVTGTITLTSGELLISKNLTIIVPGASSLAISGNNSYMVFNIGSGTVAISGLTIQNGRGSAGAAGDAGGGITNSQCEGRLTLTNSTLSGNSAPYGGGIFNVTGSATLKNAIVANSPSGGNCYVGSGTFTSQGHNLSADAACSSLFNQFGDLNSTPARARSQRPPEQRRPDQDHSAAGDQPRHGCRSAKFLQARRWNHARGYRSARYSPASRSGLRHRGL